MNIYYTGKDCQTNLNECESAPCQNDGQCVDDLNMYKCKCEIGYEGLACEKMSN